MPVFLEENFEIIHFLIPVLYTLDKIFEPIGFISLTIYQMFPLKILPAYW